MSTLTKIEEFKLTGSTVCARHGKHDDWKFQTPPKNSLYCRLCKLERERRKQRRHQVDKEYQREYKKRKPIHNRLWNAKADSKRVGRQFELNVSDIIELLKNQQYKCKLTQLPICEASLSIDRIDSSKGYTLDNIQLVLRDINFMKNTLPINRFIELCKAVANNHGPI